MGFVMWYFLNIFKKQTFGNREEYCVCHPNYYGEDCSKYIKIKPIDEDILLFGNFKNKIVPKWEMGRQLPNARGCDFSTCKSIIFVKIACVSYGDFNVCTELKDTIEKFECRVMDCIEICGLDICKMDVKYQKVCIYIYIFLIIDDIL